ncbi:hypothetical protein CVT26_015031 [Gymnopilus dilepis]|uniref:Uncharacterized protein n=1 Tax=Gymnopilus dilepis TaxID=231916 RepID=A0A409W441_9AGAR|nr:hypothetical protein CVT26_015031 [Gymnopilus dilepis]
MSLVAGVSLAGLAPGSPVSVSILSTGDSSYSLALEERIDQTTSIDKALQSAFERLSSKVPNKLDHVIFTLPIYFTEAEKEVVYSAAKSAGWLVPRNLEGILNHVQSYHRSTVEENYAPQYELVLDIGPSAAGSRLVSTEVEENVRVSSDEVVDHVVPQHVDVQEIVRKIVDPAVAKLPSATALKRVVVIGSSTDAVAPLVEELRSRFSSNDSVQIIVPSEQPSQHAAKLALALRQFALSDKLCVFNTAPLRIGIAKSDGFVLTLLPKNFTLPNKRSALLTTSQDNQTRVAIRIVAGVSPRVGENTVVAELTLEGLAPRPAGTSNVKVTIDADETGATKIITEEIDDDGQSIQQKTVELKALTGDMTEDELEAYWKQGDSVVDEEAVAADAAWAGKTVQGALAA